MASPCSLLLYSQFLLSPPLLCLSFSSVPLFSSTSSEKDRGLGPAAGSAAELRLWSDRKPRKVADRLLELILCSLKKWTVAQSIKHTLESVYYKENKLVLLLAVLLIYSFDNDIHSSFVLFYYAYLPSILPPPFLDKISLIFQIVVLALYKLLFFCFATDNV